MKSENEKCDIENQDEKYYIVRCDRAGVFYGKIKARSGREVTMTNARRIWYWGGAATLSQLAMEGAKQPGTCKFSMPVEEIVLLEAIEITPCTEQARASIDGVAEWKV